MTSWKKKMEAWSSAVAFAEAGERETALEFVDAVASRDRERTTVAQHVSDAFSAVAFAEEGCHEMAREIMESGKGPKGFLERVGLKDVPVHYAVVPVRQGFFLDVLGLKKAPVRYGKVAI